MTRQRKPKEDFEIVPQAPRYEMNSMGIMRNRKTGRILKWQVRKSGNKIMTLRNDKTKVHISQYSLLWFLFGKITAKKAPVTTFITKGTRTLRFDSLKQCAMFLEKVTPLSSAGVCNHLWRRHTKIADWNIRYQRW